MGRNKIKIEKIKNERTKQVINIIYIKKVTYFKRKKGLIKKSMELGLLCDAQILLCVVEKTDKMTVYASDELTMGMMQEYLTNSNVPKEFLMNNDVLLYF